MKEDAKGKQDTNWLKQNKDQMNFFVYFSFECKKLKS